MHTVNQDADTAAARRSTGYRQGIGTSWYQASATHWRPLRCSSIAPLTRRWCRRCTAAPPGRPQPTATGCRLRDDPAPAHPGSAGCPSARRRHQLLDGAPRNRRSPPSESRAARPAVRMTFSTGTGHAPAAACCAKFSGSAAPFAPASRTGARVRAGVERMTLTTTMPARRMPATAIRILRHVGQHDRHRSPFFQPCACSHAAKASDISSMRA